MPTIDAQLCVGCNACVRSCCMGLLIPGEKVPQLHPRRTCISCTHCSAACPTKAISFEMYTQEELYAPYPSDPVLSAITARRSIRHFKEELPDRDLIRRALDYTQYGPSGKNFRTGGWIVLMGRQRVADVTIPLLESVRRRDVYPELVRMGEERVGKIMLGAPCLILGHNEMDNINATEDTVAALTLAELVLSHFGLGVCWSGYVTHNALYDPWYSRQLGAPEGHKIFGALMVGLPDHERYLRPAYRPPATISWQED